MKKGLSSMLSLAASLILLSTALAAAEGEYAWNDLAIVVHNVNTRPMFTLAETFSFMNEEGEGAALIPQMLSAQERGNILKQVEKPLALNEEDMLKKAAAFLELFERSGGSLDELGVYDESELVQELRKLNEDLYSQCFSDDIRLLSQSPDGRRWFGVAGSLPFLYEAGTGEAKAVMINPYSVDIIQKLINPPEDTGHAVGILPLVQLYQSLPETLYDATSFNWSPDGRYLALTFWRAAVLKMRTQDLYVVDTQEGTIQISRAFGREGFAPSVIQACFSADSQTLYHTIYGNINEGRITIWAQNVSNGENTFVASGEKETGDAVFGDLAQLLLLSDGRLLQIMDAPKAGAAKGLFAYAPSGTGAWKRSEYTLPVTSLAPWSIAYAPNIDKGLLHFRSNSPDPVRAFSLFDVADGFSGMDQLLILRSFEAQTAQRLPLLKIAMEDTPPGDFGLHCLAAAISPNSNRALLFLMDPVNQELGFMLLDMDSLEATPVRYAGDHTFQQEVQAALASNTAGLHWASNEEVSLSLRGRTLSLGWKNLTSEPKSEAAEPEPAAAPEPMPVPEPTEAPVEAGLQGTAWIGGDHTLCIFENDGKVTVVCPGEDGRIAAREMQYRMSGSGMLLQDPSDGTLFLGSLSENGFLLEGALLTRVETPQVEPAEAPGIAGGWTDEAGENVLLLHPNKRLGLVSEAQDMRIDDAGYYARYGPYVYLVPIEEIGEALWVYYDEAADQLTPGYDPVHRMPLGQAIALGLDMGSAHAP